MNSGTKFIEQLNTPIFVQGGRLGLKGAFVGSIVFAFVEVTSILINTYLIQHIDASFSILLLLGLLGWAIFIIVLGNMFAFIPAFVLGGILAYLLNKDMERNVRSERRAVVKGVLLGTLASLIICLPILCIQYISVLETGHGDYKFSVLRAIEATIIASFSGGWTGKQLLKHFIQQEGGPTPHEADVSLRSH